MIGQEFQLPQKEPILEMWLKAGNTSGSQRLKNSHWVIQETKGLWSGEADMSM